jgi:hypothetical protein
MRNAMQSPRVNLRALFGDRFRVGFEESYHAQYGAHARVDNPWLQLLLCEKGTIGPWGGTKLVASTNTSGATATALKALACVQVKQDGADGVNAIFDVADVDQVLRLLKPRRRRRPNYIAEQRQAIGRRLQVARQGAGNAMRQPRLPARPCASGRPVDSQAVPRFPRLFDS